MTEPGIQDYLDAPYLSDFGRSAAASADDELLDSCPVCESARVRPFATLHGMPYSRCRECGFVFTNPYPSRAATEAFYNSNYYSNFRRLELDRRSRDPYFSISMYTDPRRLAGWLKREQPKTVLDYGCGSGAFLALLRDEFDFRHVEGLEVNRESIGIARECYGLSITANQQELRSTEYDCVLLLEVIEHLAHPAAFLAEVARLVRPGGFILITTPAVDNVVGRYLPSWCTHYAPPSHVSLFTWKSLQHLLARCDFEPVRLERDRAWQLLWATASALLYKLDFQSPRHGDDLSDGIYRPNRLGRMLGLTERRFSNVPLLPLLGLLDALAGKLLARVPGVPMNNHFYVMARRTPTSVSSSNVG